MQSLRRWAILCFLNHMAVFGNLCLAQAPDNPGAHLSASVAGRVVGPDAAGAKLEMFPLRAGLPRNFRFLTAFEATAASDGSFRIDGVTPGIYKLSTEGEHHQYSEYGAEGPGLEGLAVVLNAGQRLQGLDVKTYAKPSVCGTVFGADGRPRSGIEVQMGGPSDNPQSNGAKHVVTNANGRYVFVEAVPGEIWLHAIDGGKIIFPASPDENMGFADVTPNQQGCAFNIYLRNADGGSVLSHSVSGAVEGSFDASLGDRLYVALEPSFGPDVNRVQLKQPGAFTLNNVFPGKYTLVLYGEYGNGTIQSWADSICSPCYYRHPLASQPITVSKRNVRGLRLSVGKLPTLDGEIIADEKLPQGWNTPSLTLFWGSESKTIKAEADGHFSLPALDTFRYGFSVTGKPPESAYARIDYGPVYIASADLDGKPVTGRHFELRIGQKGRLVIHVKVGATSGKITIAPGGPQINLSSGRRLTAVFMIPDPLPEDSSGIFADWPDGAGTDAAAYFRSVPPGKYRVLAVDNLQVPSWRSGWEEGPPASWHDFLVKLAALGSPVEVVTGQPLQFTAPVVTEQAQRLKAEMGMTSVH